MLHIRLDAADLSDYPRNIVHVAWTDDPERTVRLPAYPATAAEIEAARKLAEDATKEDRT